MSKADLDMPPAAANDDDRRILVISDIGCPPPHMGNRVRMQALLREMRSLGFEVHFAGVNLSAEEERATRAEVDQWVGEFSGGARRSLVARLLRRGRRLLVDRGLMQHQVDEWFADHWLAEAQALQRRFRYSRVFVAYVFHSKFLEAFADPCVRILDTHDVFSNRRSRLAEHGIKDYWFSISPAGERKALVRASRIVAIQDDEADYFRHLTDDTREVQVVGHFTDVADNVSSPALQPRVGFVGSSNPLNVHGVQWLIDEVWPTIRGRSADAELLLAGDVAGAVEPELDVRCLGRVDDLSAFYADCRVVVNPIQTGTGLKIKTIEALAHGRPVVTTPCGADGLDTFVGSGLVVRARPDDFASAVLELLADPAEAAALGESARQRAQQVNARNRQALDTVLAVTR